MAAFDPSFRRRTSLLKFVDPDIIEGTRLKVRAGLHESFRRLADGSIAPDSMVSGQGSGGALVIFKNGRGSDQLGTNRGASVISGKREGRNFSTTG